MALSMVAVAGLAYDAGLRSPTALIDAVAIATAESGRDPRKVGDLGLQDSKWGPSVGLWQIRSLKSEKGKGTTRDADKLTDPAHNAKAMVEISGNGKNWDPWSVTHVSDPAGFLRYQAAIGPATSAVSIALETKGAQKAVEDPAGAAGSLLDPVEELAGTISDIAQTPVRVANWLTEPGSWVRIAYFVAGGLLLVLGVAKVVQGPMTAQAAKVVTNVVPAGKALKKVVG